MKSYLRFLRQNKLYTAIEVIGLSVAITICLPTLSYMVRLHRINRAHPDHESIYSLCVSRMQTSSPGIGKYLQENIPEIEIVSSPSHLSALQTFQVEEKMVPYIRFDRNYLYFFPHEFIEGGLDTDNMSTMAVSESFANELSESGPVIGRQMDLDGERYMISGIYKDVTDPRFREYMMMIPRKEKLAERDIPYAGMNILVMTLIKAKEGTDYEHLKEKVQKACASYWGPMDDREFENPYSLKRPEQYDLVPYRQITQKGTYQLRDIGGSGFIILTIIAALLLFFAILNYINLNVALSTKRAKETATRKLIGASRADIISLFLKESLAMSVICLGLGLLFTGVTTDMINTFFQAIEGECNIAVGYSPADIGIYIGFILVVAVITGLVPAMIVSRFTPLDIVKGCFRYYSKKRMTKVFICIQTILTIIVLALTLVLNAQYRKNVNMEYNCGIEDVFNLIPDFRIHSEAIKSELEKHPEILSVGKTFGIPSNAKFVDANFESRSGACYIECTKESFDIFDFEIISMNAPEDYYGIWMTPEAERISGLYPDEFRNMLHKNFGDIRIAGMIENIPSQGGQNGINDFPMVVVVRKDISTNGLVIKTVSDHKKARKVIASVYENVTGIKTTDIMDFGMRSLYVKEINERDLAPHKALNSLLVKLLGILIILGIMGLSGISMYFAGENEKEIAVRKTFGGTKKTEIWRILKTFIRITLIANLIAIPLAAVAFSTVMKYSADKVTNIWIIYASCVVISFAITIGAVLLQTLRAASTNPAEALKKE